MNQDNGEMTELTLPVQNSDKKVLLQRMSVFLKDKKNQENSELTELTLRGTLPTSNSDEKVLLQRKTGETCKLKLREEISVIVSYLEKGDLVAIGLPPVSKKRWRKYVEPSLLPVIQNDEEYTKYLNKVYYKVNLSTEKIIYNPDQTAEDPNAERSFCGA